MNIWGNTKISESNLQQSLRQTLGGGERINELTVSSLEAFARKVFADELDKTNKKKFWKTRLTWNSSEAERMAPDDLVVGEWNRRLPYIAAKTWVVQNCILMNIAGQRITLDDLSDSKHTWVDKTGTPHIAPSDRETAARAMDIYRADALAEDPLFCTYCVGEAFRAKDWDERTRHIYAKHPVEFASMVGVPIAASLDVAAASVKNEEEAPVMTKRGKFPCCGKEYSSLGRLNQHRSASANHKG